MSDDYNENIYDPEPATPGGERSQEELAALMVMAYLEATWAGKPVTVPEMLRSYSGKPIFEDALMVMIAALSRAKAEAVEECCRAVCVLCARGNVPPWLYRGQWIHGSIEEGEDCLADQIRYALAPKKEAGNGS